MAFILNDILRLPGKLLRRVVKVKTGSRQMPGSETTYESAAKGRRGKKSNRPYRTGEDLRWPKTVFILDNTVLAPLKLVRWVVNKVRGQVDADIANESGSAGGAASRDRPGPAASRQERSTSSDQR